MANQKEYKIIIGGIKESIDGIGTLQDSLDRLGKKVEESGGHFQTASKGMDELAKTEEKIKNYNEEYATALAANKAVLADHNKEVKAKIDLEKAEITVQEGLTDTYAHKQQLLTALGKVIKNTTGDTSALKEQYATLNQELKDFDAELGNHQRNVGNYEIATKNLKAELKELTAQIASMLANGVDKADPALAKLIDRAGKLADAMADARQEINRSASDTRKLDDAINIAQSATATFTLWKGAMSAFGVETEGAVEAIQKLQGAMGVLQSLQQLQDSLSQNSATAKIFSKAISMMGISMDGATKASKLLKIGLMGIGIGLIIALVSELVIHWDELVGWFTKTFPALKNLSTWFNKVKGAIAGVGEAVWAAIKSFGSLGKILKALFSGHWGEAVEIAKNNLKIITNAFNKGYADEMGKIQEKVTLKQTEEENKRTKHNLEMLKAQKGNQAKFSKEGIALQKKDFEERKRLAKGNQDELNKIAVEEASFYREMQENKTAAAKKAASEREKIAKEEAERRKRIADDWAKAEREGLEAAKALRDETNEKQKKDAEGVAKAKDKLSKSEYERDLAILDAEKERLTIEGKYLTKEEDIRKNKDKINQLEAKRLKMVRDRAAIEAKNEAASALGIDPSKIDEILDLTTGKYKDLTEEQKLVIDNLKTQLETLDIGLATALSKLFGGESSTGDSDNTQNPLAKFFDNNIVQGFVDATLDSIAVIGDAIADLYDMELEEMEEKLDQLAELHDEAVEKVNESQDKISDLNQKMKDSSGAQLEAYKQQMADEMLLLQQRQQEEKRVQKEKEKQEEAIKKKQKQARKDEMKVQLIESIVNTALAVTKTFSAYPMPFAAILGGIVSTLGAIQQAIIIKQMSKLADGGLLSGPSHANGGIPVGNTGVEVEGGEYVVNKRSTAKYLPLLQSINEEGARHKTVANQIGKMADGGQLNYERINSNLDSLSTASIVASAISGIDLHPVVSVQEISRVQRNIVEVRELSGARN